MKIGRVKRKGGNKILKSSVPEELREEGSNVDVYIEKYYINGEVSYNIGEVTDVGEISIGENIEQKDYYYQAIIRGETKKKSNYSYRIKNIRILEESPLHKPKEQVKEIFVNLMKICYPNKYMQNDEMVNLGLEGATISESGDIRCLEKSDLKVTSVWSDKKSMHLGKSGIGKDYTYKLGVNWSHWNKSIPEKLLRSLTHEMTHCTHMHHKESFYLEHARAIKNLCRNERVKKYVEKEIMGCEINWNVLKADVLRGPHRQPKDIDMTGFKNRLEACSKVDEKMGDILEYDYNIGNIFYLNPLYHEGKIRCGLNGRNDEIERVQLCSVETSDEFTDDEIYNIMKKRLKDDTEQTPQWVYEYEDLPVVDSEGEVQENEWFIEMIRRMETGAQLNPLREVNEGETKIPVLRV